jgi:hypothetical protein
MKDIRKQTGGDNDTESFLQWARMFGKSSGKSLTDVPQLMERAKLRLMHRE